MWRTSAAPAATPASGQVARAPADGYTVMVISTGFVVNPSLYARVPYDPIKDFAPVTLVAASPNVVVVNPSVPAKTIPELVQLITRQSRQVFASPVRASARRRICRANCSSCTSTSIWCTCRSPAPGRRSRRRSAATRRSRSPRMPPAIAAVKDGKLRALGVAAQQARRRAARPSDLRGAGRQGPGSRHAHRHRGAGRHAEGDRRPAAAGGRKDRGAAAT